MPTPLDKMTATLGDPIQYALPMGEAAEPLNAYLGQRLRLHHTGNIYCDHCHKRTPKSYAQGHCFSCMKTLASCDNCIIRPETCHHHLGTCREPEWGLANCFAPHIVYLANTSGLKVGITRQSQVPTRWIDQGATQALPLLRVKSRLVAGLVEVALAQHVADKTNWRALLRGDPEPCDMHDAAATLLAKLEPALAPILAAHGEDAIERLSEDVVTLDYPVLEYPGKIASHNFDKDPEVAGVLLGIKGQYLMFDTGVINVRKFTGYDATLA
ncbi:MAG: DUF2797 domain-containing protein [Pseudomonadota bacterium]